MYLATFLQMSIGRETYVLWRIAVLWQSNNEEGAILDNFSDSFE
mgnify:CR=1 FL=1